MNNKELNIILLLVKYLKALSILVFIIIISITSTTSKSYKNEIIMVEPVMSISNNNITLEIGETYIINIKKNTAIDDVKLTVSNNNIEITETEDNQYEAKAIAKGHSDVIFSYDNNKKKIVVNFHIESNEPLINYAGEILKSAFNELGYTEKATNSNLNSKTANSGSKNFTKYGKWYGINPGKWCAMFVSWCSYKSGVSNELIKPFASVSIGMDWFKNQGLFKTKNNYKPKAGDIIFFKSNGASHTGLVIASDDKYVYTIEGNTSNKVGKRYYELDYNKITGYGTPDYPNYYAFDYSNFSYKDAINGQSSSTT